MTSNLFNFSASILADAKTDWSPETWAQFGIMIVSALTLLYVARQVTIATSHSAHAAKLTEISGRAYEQDRKLFHREKAVEVIRVWSQFNTQLDPCVLHASRILKGQQLNDLVERKEFKINAGQAKQICKLLNLKPPTPGTRMTLELPQVLLIRAEVIRYLNMLEWCLAVWARISRDELIIEQFSGLADDKTGEMPLAKIRKAAESGANFPCIAEFEKYLKTQKTAARNDLFNG